MARDFSFRSFVRELGSRLAAAGVVLGIFFGLARLKTADIPVVSAALETQFVFFVAAFGLVGLAAALWIGFRQYTE
ncbi:hypothetical protein [Halobaculum sp. D14]|uniref:hypothetical protein n=1 Tax=Halobaculum sp. D14 TaxID=3421642 RepID=UPI003EC0E0FA